MNLEKGKKKLSTHTHTHTHIYKVSNLLEFYAVLTRKELQTFRRVILLSSSESRGPRMRSQLSLEPTVCIYQSTGRNNTEGLIYLAIPFTEN